MRQILPCLALLTALPLAAQSTPIHADPNGGNAEVLVLDHQFASGREEHVPVLLEKESVYRAEIDHPGAELRWYTQPGDKAPYAIVTEREVGPENRITYEIYPSQDETVEIQPVGAKPGESIHLRLYHDLRASKHRHALLHTPGWALGLEFQAGLHTAYVGDTTIGTGGSAIDACLSFRAGPGIADGTSGCAFGIELQSGVSSFRLTYFFIEPRIRVFGHPPMAGHPTTEMGLLLRGAMGSFAPTTGPGSPPSDPKLVGAGVYVARDIDSNENGHGWGMMASLSESVALGIGGNTTTGRRNATFATLKVGVGRYF